MNNINDVKAFLYIAVGLIVAVIGLLTPGPWCFIIPVIGAAISFVGGWSFWKDFFEVLYLILTGKKG